MATEKIGLIERFEAWLKPSFFYFFLVLLIFLNLIVWFYWKPLKNANVEPAVLAGLLSERDHLNGLLAGSCTNTNLQSYGRGEVGPLASITASGIGESAYPQSRLVELLNSAAVVVAHADGSGSGFFIDPTTIVTNLHVIEGVKGESVFVGGKAIGSFQRAKIISVSRSSEIGSADFALLRLQQAPAGIKVLPIAGKPEPLQNVVAVGFPGSAIQSDQSQVPDPIYTTGNISAVQPQSTGVSFVIHTADISPGSSGGALVDRCGAVVGVNTFIQSADSKAEGRRLYALSSDSLLKFLDASGQRYTRASDCLNGQTN